MGKTLTELARDALRDGLSREEFVERVMEMPKGEWGAVAWACRSAYQRAESEVALRFDLHREVGKAV